MSSQEGLIGTRIADRYRITGEIGAGGMGHVYRAMPFADPSQDVAIKVIRSDQNLGPQSILRFQKEAALMSRLYHPNIICFHELGLFGHEDDVSKGLGQGYYIVMELANGRNLKESLAIDSRKDLAFFFEVALQVVSALDYTHGKNITHQDIKPQNIIVGKAWQEQRGIIVKVLDFGVARLTEVTKKQELRTKKQDFDVVGTPLYMAPEQTPFIDAPIDHRVDLYSLGCVLYEILAGRVPFIADTKEKLMRHHVNTMPEPLTAIRPDIPKIIEVIIHKLLAKYPDDRYQTAFGLMADLQKAKKIIEIDPKSYGLDFHLGTKDRFKAVSTNIEIVGRDLELEQLKESYRALSEKQARSRLSVIKGSSGVGKTKLLIEFRSYLAAKKIRYISVGFSRHENNLPFNALANGFNEYLFRIQKTQPQEAEELRNKVKTLLGSMAHQVAAVVPGLKSYIASDIDVETEKEQQNLIFSMYTYDEQHHDFHTFAKAFSDFTRCLATDNQPVVFIFDDMHWADNKSIELIDKFFSHNNALPFFMVIAYSSLHTLNSNFELFLEKFCKLRRRFQEINLQKFDSGSVKCLIGNMLGSSDQVSDALVRFLYAKTLGNPMYLVELLKTLVATGKIGFSIEKNIWEYDTNEIQRSKVILDSVDLTLSRIQTYSEDDRKILEIAAIIGMTFQFELLLLGGTVQLTKAQKTLQRAIDEGLIIRSPDVEELKHLGKSYTFIHKRAREAIHDEIPEDQKASLHEMVLGYLEKSTPNPGSKTILTLAHHANAAMMGNQSRLIPNDLVERCVKHNINAGKAAITAESWQSAQRYYENAYLLLKRIKKNALVLHAENHVLSSLAEIATHQLRYTAALRLYRSLLKRDLPIEIYSRAMDKCISLQIIKGLFSIARAGIEDGFKKLSLPRPVMSCRNKIRLLLSVIRDIMSTINKKDRLSQLIMSSSNKELKGKKTPDRNSFDIGVNLYRKYQLINLIDDPSAALIAHDHALNTCFSKSLSITPVLLTVADRALLLGYLGFIDKSYYLLEMAVDVANNLGLKEVVSLLLLKKTLLLDHYQGKHEGLGRKIKIAISSLSIEYNRDSISIGIIHLMISNFFKGKLSRVLVESQNLNRIVKVRGFISPKNKAIYLITLLFMGTWDLLVKDGDNYLKKRKEVNGRFRDLSVYIIQCVVAYAKGEFTRCREYYIKSMLRFLKGDRVEFLYPLEQDLYSIFIMIFPKIFEGEGGRKLLSVQDQSFLFRNLRKHATSFRSRQRPVAKLIVARTSELFNERKVKQLYDEAITSSKVCGNFFTRQLAYLWFGKYLLNHGLDRKEYIIGVYKEASNAKLNFLADFAERIIKKFNLPFEDKKSKGWKSKKEKKKTEKMSLLLFKHLYLINEIFDTGVDFKTSIKESMRIIFEYYRFLKISCYLITDEEDDLEMIHPNIAVDANHRKIIDYINPYFNIRSSLFLPTSDAPWHESSVVIEKGDHTMDSSTEVYDGELNTLVNNNLNETRALSTTAIPETYSKSSISGQIVNTSKKYSKRKGQLMNVLIPIKYELKNLGFIFIEGNDIAKTNTAIARKDFDQFGAQLGLVVHRKKGIAESNKIFYPNIFNRNMNSYATGRYHLEKVDWLDIWTKGFLRKERECGWYLGLNLGDDYYLLVYCRLNGPNEIRDQLSSMIYNHIYVLRTSGLLSGKNTLSISELCEELLSLLQTKDNYRLLEGISLTFSLFSAEKKCVFSGQLGPSRPLVLFTENEVVPRNEIVFSLENGRTLRFFEVIADLSCATYIYILPHNSSKIDNIQLTSSKDLLSAAEVELNKESHSIKDRRMRIQKKSESFHNFLKEIIMETNIPRYYVAASLVDDRDREDSSGDNAWVKNNVS